MNHYLPPIFYHDRTALYSVDVHPVIEDRKFRIVTASVQTEVRIWEGVFEESAEDKNKLVLGINFVANLTDHTTGLNVVRFCQNPELNLLASGDNHGRIIVWQLSNAPYNGVPADGIPPNRDNWVRFKVLTHERDITGLCWSPCGKYLASISEDDSLLVHEAMTGKRMFSTCSLRHKTNGISWDPLGKYLVTMSTDRKMELFDAVKGTRLRSFGATEMPSLSLGSCDLENKVYKMFYDDNVIVYQRGVSFSPCGQLILAPCARLEVGDKDVYGSYVFRRWELEKDKPAVFLPCPVATFCVRFCPLIFDLVPDSPNYSGLPYRMIFAVVTKYSVLMYDTQHPTPIGLVDDISLNPLSDAAWSKDGKNLIISSLEGYCSFIRVDLNQWGSEIQLSACPVCPPSPQLIKQRRKIKTDKKAKQEAAQCSEIESVVKKTPPKAEASQPTTPKAPNILKFISKIGTSTPGESSNSKTPNEKESGMPLDAKKTPDDKESSAPTDAKKPKKRIENLITLT